MAASRTHYDILEVPNSASSEDIRKNYRKLGLRYHPDKAPPEKKLAYQEHFKDIVNAYEVLSDSTKRRNYDLSLRSAASAEMKSTATRRGHARTASSKASTPPRPVTAELLMSLAYEALEKGDQVRAWRLYSKINPAHLTNPTIRADFYARYASTLLAVRHRPMGDQDSRSIYNQIDYLLKSLGSEARILISSPTFEELCKIVKLISVEKFTKIVNTYRSTSSLPGFLRFFGKTCAMPRSSEMRKLQALSNHWQPFLTELEVKETIGPSQSHFFSFASDVVYIPNTGTEKVIQQLGAAFGNDKIP